MAKVAQCDVARLRRQGRQRRAADRPRHDDRADGRGARRRREIRRRRSLSRRAAHEHRLRPTTRSSALPICRLQRPGDRLPGRAGLAPGRRRLGDGQRGRAQAFSLRWSRRPAASASKLRELGVRPYGVVRIDSATGVHDWAQNPAANTEADRPDFPRGLRRRRGLWRAAGRGRRNLLGRHAQLEAHGRSAGDGRRGRRRSAFRPTWRTRCSTPWATTRPRIAFCRADFDWQRQEVFDAALKEMTHALRPWTIDFHVAQNDATVKGLRLARQDGPALHGRRSQRQARYRA